TGRTAFRTSPYKLFYNLLDHFWSGDVLGRCGEFLLRAASTAVFCSLSAYLLCSANGGHMRVDPLPCQLSVRRDIPRRSRLQRHLVQRSLWCTCGGVG